MVGLVGPAPINYWFSAAIAVIGVWLAITAFRRRKE